ncbi:MAG: PDZ domain-containing protein [Lachnospiraceae bacterium]|nr:PDZ domain-containing protein [Lachnospiraceae bacterium]
MSKKINKAFGMIFSGILFGSFAGLMIVVILYLFPPAQTEGGSEAENSVTVEQAEHLEAEDEQQENKQEPEVYAQSGEIDATETADSGKESREIAIVTDVTMVVDRVMPSVVSIFGTYMITEDFWGYQFRQEDEGSGSGIIVGENEEELLIVTNNHVVADSTSLSVQFVDEQTCSAQVKGTDADSDLAVIAVNLEELGAETKREIRIATLGDSDSLKVGEPAIAIGNALGYGQSVTTGVISAVNRQDSMNESGESLFLIQTDAAINPGNSGGALLNVYGEVVGINSSKIGGSMVEGMGYAIPISTAKPIIEELMSKKTRVPVSENEKGYLGISGINVTDEVHERYGLPHGVYIAQVYGGTPAERAGLKKGDIITYFDGESVETMEELSVLLDCSQAGSNVQIGVMVAAQYGYEERMIEVVLGGRN